MAATRQTAAETIEDVIKRRPVLAPVLRTFEPLLTAQDELGDAVAECLKKEGVSLPQAQPQRIVQGVSLLAEASFAGVAPAVRLCAEKLLPILCSMDTVVPHKGKLTDFFLKSDKIEVQDMEDLVAAIAAGNRKMLADVAEKNDLDPLVLDFVTGFIVAPVLHGLAAQTASEEGEAPWDSGDAWRQGYCPVCGALPTIGWLDKPAFDEKNAFLAGGGGKKHLHCGVCGANWKYRRGACPACGEEGSNVMELLRESGDSYGERLDWCTKCKSYCPVVDLREREVVPHLDALALGMMHLDMVAARKKLKPVKPSFWNMY